jgi:membrane protease YdiL (CAAX protease family)
MLSDPEDSPPKSREIPRRTFLMLEVLALSATHLSTIVDPLLGIPVGNVARYSYLNPYAFANALGEIPRAGIYLFVMFASGDPMGDFGLRKIRWKGDLIALLLAVAGSAAVYGAGGLFLDPTRRSSHLPILYDQRVAPVWMLAILCLLIGFYEEVANRGYLIPRLEEIFGSTWLAVVLQALFFGLVHTYEGFSGVANATLIGVVYGLVFVKWRSVWPLVLAHAATDFTIFYRYAH